MSAATANPNACEDSTRAAASRRGPPSTFSAWKIRRSSAAGSAASISAQASVAAAGVAVGTGR